MLFSRRSQVTSDEQKVQELLNRGTAAVIPRDLAEKKLRSGERLRVYWGIDPTGPHIHLGHTLSLRKLKAFADLGHEVILVIGSFTAMIGDPTGRDAARAPLRRKMSKQTLKTTNAKQKKFSTFLRFKFARTATGSNLYALPTSSSSRATLPCSRYSNAICSSAAWKKTSQFRCTNFCTR
jgi:tyrosyl-tRNA synthetase